MSDHKTQRFLDLNTLITVRSYAKLHNLSVTHVYYLAKNKKIEMVMVDGVKFIRHAYND